ncbi:MAG: hypothetical protein PHP85_03440 [Gallionella sp.]|nr:hypothetical protein [Gallionella sp.]
MKRFVMTAALLAATLPAFAADVGVSLSIGQPGFYGRIDIGDYYEPQVIYRRPMVIERVSADRPPVYLRVPPGHAKNWRRHCREYHACGERVYFVQDNWYNNEYVPRYREQHGKENRRDEYRDEYRGNRGEENRGEGNRGEGNKHDDRGGHGRGHDK